MIYLSIFKGSYSVQLRRNLYHFFPEREEESCEGREGLKRRCCPASTHVYTAMRCMKRFCCGDTASQHPQRSWVVSALPDTSRVKVSCCLTGCSLTLAEQGDWSFQSHTVICIGEITSSYRKSPVKSTRFSTGPRPSVCWPKKQVTAQSPVNVYLQQLIYTGGNCTEEILVWG